MATAPQRVIDNTVERLSHGDRVELNVNSENLLSEPEEIFGSWRRCSRQTVEVRDAILPDVTYCRQVAMRAPRPEGCEVSSEARSA